MIQSSVRKFLKQLDAPYHTLLMIMKRLFDSVSKLYLDHYYITLIRRDGQIDYTNGKFTGLKQSCSLSSLFFNLVILFSSPSLALLFPTP